MLQSRQLAMTAQRRVIIRAHTVTTTRMSYSAIAASEITGFLAGTDAALALDMRFTKQDAGCYADGSFGHNHVREVLGSLLVEVGRPDLQDELLFEMSDDACEEYDALDILNAECEGCYFEMVDGDLMLTAEEDL